jgi:hypothetical protein
MSSKPQRPQMARVRGYVSLWLDADELLRIRAALGEPARRRGGALSLRDRVDLAATWAAAKEDGR